MSRRFADQIIVGYHGWMSHSPLPAIDARLADAVDALSFAAPVHTVVNTLRYTAAIRADWHARWGHPGREALFVGMNPGPWGMMQTGIPFGTVSFVRDWMGLRGTVEAPPNAHPARPIRGLDCPRAEVSGTRLWSWARDRFGEADAFFSRFFVVNWCPLAFLEASGKNRTPDQLPAAEFAPLAAACDAALRETVAALKPRLVIGIGAVAEAAARRALGDGGPRIGRVLHPSPANPAANCGWIAAFEAGLRELGVALP